MANERDSTVAVVHGCFPERGDSILRAFSWEILPASCKTTNKFLWLAN